MWGWGGAAIPPLRRLGCCLEPHGLVTSSAQRACRPLCTTRLLRPPTCLPQDNCTQGLGPAGEELCPAPPGHTPRSPPLYTPPPALRLSQGRSGFSRPPPSRRGEHAGGGRAQRAGTRVSRWERAPRAEGGLGRARGGREWRVGRARRWRGGRAGLARQVGATHGRRERARDGSSARRPAPRTAPAGSSVRPGGPGRPRAWDPSCGRRRGSPRASASHLPPLGKGHEEATTAHVGRSGKRGPCGSPSPPAPPSPLRRQAHGAGTPINSGFRATGTAGPTPSHFLRDRARHGPEALRDKGPPSSKPSPAPRSRRPQLTSVGLSHSPAAKTWGSRRPRGRGSSPEPGAQRRRSRRRRQVQPRPAARA